MSLGIIRVYVYAIYKNKWLYESIGMINVSYATIIVSFKNLEEGNMLNKYINGIFKCSVLNIY